MSLTHALNEPLLGQTILLPQNMGASNFSSPFMTYKICLEDEEWIVAMDGWRWRKGDDVPFQKVYDLLDV